MATERMEVITRTERRRRWSSADKVRLVMATREPGATVSSVAREHGVSESLLYSWRGRLARTTAVGADIATTSGFAPVCVVDGRPAPVMVAGDGGVVATEAPAMMKYPAKTSRNGRVAPAAIAAIHRRRLGRLAEFTRGWHPGLRHGRLAESHLGSHRHRKPQRYQRAKHRGYVSLLCLARPRK